MKWIKMIDVFFKSSSACNDGVFRISRETSGANTNIIVTHVVSGARIETARRFNQLRLAA